MPKCVILGSWTGIRGVMSWTVVATIEACGVVRREPSSRDDVVSQE